MDDPLPDGIDLVEVEAVDHEGDEEGPQQRSPHCASAARDGGPADNDGGDHAEHEAEVVRGCGTDGPRCRHYARESGGEPRQREHGHYHLPCSHACEPCSFGIAACGVHVSAESGAG